MKITAAATVLPVRDIDQSLRYFTEVLGFTQEFRFDNYASIERDRALIHLSQQGNPNTAAPGSGGIYIFCDEVDDFYSEITARGATVGGEPQDYPYGMRDFVVHDPDGNKVSFGCPTSEPDKTSTAQGA
ncbi:MAG: bleomycin resistance protein [Phycisphaeraceae bacterium]